MADPYKVTTLITASETKALFDLYQERKGTKFSQDFNLFNIVKKNLPGNYHGNTTLKVVMDKLCDYCKQKVSVIYFLKYSKGSFAKMHVDNPDNYNYTSITMVYSSPNLIGGESIIHKDLDESDIGSGKTSFSKSGKNIILGKPLVPIVIRQPVGTTLWYDKNTSHGVSRVDRGERVVLVTWFGERNA